MQKCILSLEFCTARLQGVPMGLSGVFPFVLKELNVSYSELGTFSMSSYPFALKLFWAPIVDAVYVERFGRRKTWVVLMVRTSASRNYWITEIEQEE